MKNFRNLIGGIAVGFFGVAVLAFLILSLTGLIQF